MDVTTEQDNVTTEQEAQAPDPEKLTQDRDRFTLRHIAALSDEDLDAIILELNNERDTVREHIDEMQAERSKRHSHKRLSEKLASLSPEEIGKLSAMAVAQTVSVAAGIDASKK